MRPSLAAAREINALWVACAGSRVDLAKCPTDEAVAVVIEQHMPHNSGTSESAEKGGKR